MSTTAAKADLMTKAELSEYSGIPVRTLTHLRHMRTGPRSAVIAGRVMYRKADVDAWIDAQFENDPTNTAV